MKPKYQRVFLVETQFRSRMILAVVLIVTLFLLKGIVAARKGALEQTKKESDLVLNIPIMEKIIQSKTQKRVVRPVEVKEGPIDLQGTYVKDGATYALINGEVFSEGDMYGDYEVVEIEFGVAILDNQKTKERKILQFFYYE